MGDSEESIKKDAANIMEKTNSTLDPRTHCLFNRASELFQTPCMCDSPDAHHLIVRILERICFWIFTLDVTKTAL
jgi:hypothetical protein